MHACPLSLPKGNDRSQTGCIIYPFSACSKGEVTATIIIGEVVLIHVLEAVTGKTGHGHIFVDFEKYAPVSRLGGNTYARITETYDLPRPGKEWQERDAMVSKAQK